VDLETSKLAMDYYLLSLYSSYLVPAVEEAMMAAVAVEDIN
jgi:hypothetical protein